MCPYVVDEDNYDHNYDALEDHETEYTDPQADNTEIEENEADYTPFPSITTHSPNQEEENEVEIGNNNTQDEQELEDEDYEIDF